MSPASKLIVPSGTYFGFTYPELAAELARYKGEVTRARTRIVGASVNGSSYQFGAREGGTLEEWSADLQAAMHYLRPDLHCPAPSNRAAFAVR